MTALRVLFGLVAFSIAAALHVYMWRRLVRDPGWSPRVRRVLTTVIVTWKSKSKMRTMRETRRRGEVLNLK